VLLSVVSLALGAGIAIAVAFAAAAHAAYKTALFALHPWPVGIEYARIAALTFGVGVIYGLLRELADNVAPAVLAHAAFDLVVYRAVFQAPWWVWA
jgi:hypothetical protein